MKSGVVFDLDGTLLDTQSFAVPALRWAVERVNRDKNVVIGLPNDEAICRCFGGSILEYYRSLLRPWSKEIEYIVHREAMSRQKELLTMGKGRLYDGVEHLLWVLFQRGWVLAVVSCGSQEYLDAVRLSFPILSRFIDVWISATEYPGGDKVEAMRRFAISSGADVLALAGDRFIDILAAHQIGAPAIGCLYGYGSIDELASADYLAATPLHMKKIIFRLAKGIGGKSQV